MFLFIKQLSVCSEIEITVFLTHLLRLAKAIPNQANYLVNYKPKGNYDLKNLLLLHLANLQIDIGSAQ